MNIPFADIKTGHPEQSAYFCAVHYKLILFKSETSHSIGQSLSGGCLPESLVQYPAK